MPSRSRVEELIALVEKGRFVEALQTFYAEDASMQENQQPPRRGLAELVAHERRVMAAFREIEGRLAAPVLIDGDRVVLNWLFRFVDRDGRERRLDELAHQVWRGDEVAQERFYYDPAQMRG